MEDAQPPSVPIMRLGDREGTIWHAASKGDLEKLKELLRCDAALVNAGDELQMTPLMWAVWEGRPGTVRCLLQQPGLKVDAVDRYHRTAAYWAAVGERDLPLPRVVEKGRRVRFVPEAKVG